MNQRHLAILTATIVLSMALGFITPGPSQTTGLLSTTNARLTALLRDIQEHDNPYNDRVVFDTNGQPVSVKLWSSNANDADLSTISDAGSIKTLYLQTGAHAKNITREGLVSLRKLTNLTELHLACMIDMPPGMFGEICQLKNLRILSLVAEMPPPNEYTNLARLKNLEQLHISYATNFSPQEALVLTNLTNLKDLSIAYYNGSPKDTNF